MSNILAIIANDKLISRAHTIYIFAVAFINIQNCALFPSGATRLSRWRGKEYESSPVLSSRPQQTELLPIGPSLRLGNVQGRLAANDNLSLGNWNKECVRNIEREFPSKAIDIRAETSTVNRRSALQFAMHLPMSACRHLASIRCQSACIIVFAIAIDRP